MRVLILTYGTRGDTQPFVALARGLLARGHDVLLAAPERFSSLVGQYEVDFAALDDGMLVLSETPAGKAMLEDGTNLVKMVRGGARLVREASRRQLAMLQDATEAAHRFRPDCLVFHPKVHNGGLIAIEHAIPAFLALLAPYLVPTGAFPCPGFPALPLGPGYNRLTTRLPRAIVNLSTRRVRNRLAGAFGTSAPHDFASGNDGNPFPVLQAFSNVLLPGQQDWPRNVTTTGFWSLGSPPGWSPRPTLLAFLNAGPPPVYIGFGSMAAGNAGRLGRVALEAVKKAGVRAVIATGEGGLIPGALPDTVIAVNEAPHDWLFPRMAAIVHHGGAGTTSAALLAAKPNFVAPFFGDQPFWGARVHALGCGPEPVPAKTLTAEGLVQALRQMTTDPGMAERTQAIAAALREDGGIAAAIARIEKTTTIKPALSTV